jgi:two-component system phosphate regulon sensor histidine kinase PhoR
VSVAFDQAQKLDALADDLTTLSKLDYDGIALEREPSDLVRIVTDEIAGMTPRAEARKITLRVEGDEARCDIDRARIGQVVRNLIDNAIRYGTAGTDVVARVEVAEETVSFSIVDRGEGIPAEHLPLLGTPLYRVDSSRARTGAGGRGLGLAIARGLVKAHGGTLEVVSTRDVGTTVRVTLPRTAQGPIA